MISVPKWLRVGSTAAIVAYTLIFAAFVMSLGRMSIAGGVGLVAFVVALLVAVTRRDTQLGLPRTVVIVVLGGLLPFLGSMGLNPVTDTYSTGAWYLGAIAALVVELMWGRRMIAAGSVMTVLAVQTALWGGLVALNSFGVIAVTLLFAVVTGGVWAVERTGRELERYSAAERQTLEWGAAQAAYHDERQVRLVTTARLASPLLTRLAEPGPISEADRFECHVLAEAIRDEIRGRRLLNDAMRHQVLAHRRRGAFVQVHDDGGLDAVADADLDVMLDRIAAQLAPLTSTSIVVRTAPAGSANAVTVAATSVDPVSAALGLDDDETVDLWLEVPRPPARV